MAVPEEHTESYNSVDHCTSPPEEALRILCLAKA